jgi:hypothetical protein
MSSSRRQIQIGVAVVLAVVAALVVGLVAAAASRTGKSTDVTSARLVPADAALYVGVNTDLTSDQWVSAFRLVQRLGEKDPQGTLHDAAANQGNLDWKNDVTPFLGGDASIFLHNISLTDDGTDGGVVFRCRDAARALKVIEDKDGGLRNGSHNGQSYRYDADQHTYVARIDNYLVVTSSEQSLYAVLDVPAGKKSALRTDAGFRSSRADLGGSFLAFAYVNSKQLVDTLSAGNDAFQQALADVPNGKNAFQPLAMALRAKGNAFSFQSAQSLAGQGAKNSPLLAAHESRFARLVPADAAVFISTTGIAQTWDQVVKENRAQLDDALRQTGEFTSLDDALQSAGSAVGLPSAEDAIRIFTGEAALSVSFPDKTFDNPSVLVLAEVSDRQKAKDLLGKVAASANVTPRTERIGGAEVTELSDSSGQSFAYTVTDGYAAFGTMASLRALLDGKRQPLSGSDGYKATAAELPMRLGTFAYVDVAALVELSGQAPADLDNISKALKGLIINVVQDRGAAHFSGTMTIK